MQHLYVFDFDGTLSWIRHGWPALMSDLLRAHLPLLPGEAEAVREAHLQHIVFGLSGQATLVQMQRFVELAQSRQQRPPDPAALYAAYQERLLAAVEQRVGALRSGRDRPDEWTVRGARAFLAALQASGADLAIISATVEHHVRQEAALLELDPFFGGRIYGCTGDPARYRKADVFARLLGETGCPAEQLVAFGDGPVEIAEAKRLGGYAVALCTSEEDRDLTACDPRKQEQLLAAGADEAWPDFSGAIDWFHHRESHL